MTALAGLLATLAVIVAGAGLARWLFQRFGLPGVAGEILFGVALGPSLLGWALPEVHAALLPADARPVLEALSWIGLVLFVFQVGLEMHWDRSQTRPMVRIASGGLVLPLAAGMALAILAPHWFFPGEPVFKGIVLVGVVLTVSALPVLARILEDLGLKDKPLGSILMAAATFDDVVGWVLLALVAAAGSGAAALSFVGGLALAGVLALFLWGGERLARTRLEAVRPSQNLLVGTLAVVFGSAALTEAAGLNAVLGPLAAGAVLSRHVVLRDDMAERLKHVTRVVLLPIFFVASGALVDLTTVPMPQGLVPVAAVLAVASAAKVFGCAAGARWAGLPWREGLGAGALLNARGAVGLVVVKVGLDTGLFSTFGYSLLVLLVAVTTVAAPLLSRWAFPPSAKPSS